jgi:serine/threonine protein kinase
MRPQALVWLALVQVLSPAHAAERRVRVQGHAGERTVVLDRTIGEGALSTTWEAHDSSHPEHRFAVKVLRRAYRNQPEMNTFPKEHSILELMAQRSSHFPKPCGLGELTDRQPSAPVLAMELVPGRALGGGGVGVGQSWENPVHLPPGKAVRIARSLLRRLAELHAAGWAHTDVHPANVRIDDQLRSASTRLLDYGNATPYSPEDAVEDVERVARILLQSLTGQHYSSPEAMKTARGYRMLGQEHTLGDVIQSAMDRHYATPDALDAALAPFAALSP